MEYCYGIESPPKKIIILNSIGKFDEIDNPMYNRPSLISIHQETTFQSDLNDQLASLFGTHKSIRDFDLNELPPDEDE